MDFFPYPGLRPFTYKESSIFFGREEQTGQLLDRLSHTRFVVVVGPSGCGKSSLVRAGMIAALESGLLSNIKAHWWVGKMRPGSRPLWNLAGTLLRKSLLEEERPEPSAEDAEIEQYVLSYLFSGPLGLVELLRDNPLPEQTNLLLLVDQFEDLFRSYRQGNREEIKAFVALLLASVRQHEFPIYIGITLRSEFIGDCILFRGLPEIMNISQFIVPLLTYEQQQEAIIEPARMFGGDAEPRLVDRLLEEMEDEPDQLPLLQHCLMRIWLRAKSRVRASENDTEPAASTLSNADKIMMTLDDYTAVGGFKNALSNHADETFWKLDKEQQQIAEQMFRRLGDRRANSRYMSSSVKISDIASIAEVSSSEVVEIVEIFRHPERRFLTPEAEVPLDADSAVAFSHESLIRQWPQLKKWVEQEARSAAIYRHLVHTAHLWQQGKAALWRSPDLEHALEWKEQEKPTATWAKRYGGDFASAMKFLNASARRRRLKQRLIVTLISIGLVIIVSLAVWGGWERTKRIRAERSIRAGKPLKGDFRIRQAVIKDSKGLTVSSLDQRFLLKPRERVTVEVDINNPGNRKFTTEYYQFIEDKTLSDATYIVPDMPGNTDMVIVRAVDSVTGEILDQHVLKIKIVDTR